MNHDGYKSRKWWGLIICQLLLVLFACWLIKGKIVLGALEVLAYSVVALYALFTGGNLGEKITGSRQTQPSDTAGDEDEI